MINMKKLQASNYATSISIVNHHCDYAPAPEPLPIHLLYARLRAMLLHKTDKAVTFGLVRCRIANNPTVWDLSKGGKCVPQRLRVNLRAEVSNEDVVVQTCVLFGRSSRRSCPVHLRRRKNVNMNKESKLTFISLPMQSRLFIAVMAALAAWWWANSTKQ